MPTKTEKNPVLDQTVAVAIGEAAVCLLILLGYGLYALVTDYVFTYKVREKGCGVASVKAGEMELTNPQAEENGVYRTSGKTIDREWFDNLTTNHIEIELF